nr:amidohydrolase [Conexibacter arvalis]
MRDGAIAAVGDERAVRAACGPATELVDLGGATVVPGLIDGHQHPLEWGGRAARGADLAGIETLEQLLAALRAERERVGRDGWVRGWGLPYEPFAGGTIAAELIEEAVGGAPTALMFCDLHTLLATRAALAAAGIDGPRAFPDASEIVCADGVPTGELREPAAYELVLAASPQPTAAELRDEIAARLQRLHALGLTAVHVMDGSPSTYRLLAELEDEGRLTMRLSVPLWQTPEQDEATVAEHLALRDAGGALWRGGVAKFFADGVIDTGTAWLLEPDAHGDGREPLWPDPARYAERVARFAGAGFQCVTHAVGDGAVRAALDAYARAPAAPGVLHRIEHLETLADDDLAALACRPVVASMQPLHMQWRRPDGGDSWTARLGAERAARAFRTRDLIDAGARVVLGSDWPVANDDPRVGMAWARLRRPPGEPGHPPFEPAQRLSAEEALAGYTRWAAEVEHGLPPGGVVAPGMRADLTAFAEDPVDCPADELAALPVTLTVVDGKVVHRAG